MLQGIPNDETIQQNEETFWSNSENLQTKNIQAANKKIDVKKENISALRKIGYARLRDYSIAELLSMN